MTVLFVFIVAVILAVLIARYNESNKLFKILLCSLLLGMAGGTIAVKLFKDSKKDNNTTQVAPMQASPSVVLNMDALLLGDTLAKPAKPAGKATLPDRDSSITNVPSKCSGEIRAQPKCKSCIRGGPLGYWDSG